MPDKFPTATPEQQEIIKSCFEMLVLMVVNVICNLMNALMLGVWFPAIAYGVSFVASSVNSLNAEELVTVLLPHVPVFLRSGSFDNYHAGRIYV